MVASRARRRVPRRAGPEIVVRHKPRAIGSPRRGGVPSWTVCLREAQTAGGFGDPTRHVARLGAAQASADWNGPTSPRAPSTVDWLSWPAWHRGGQRGQPLSSARTAHHRGLSVRRGETRGLQLIPRVARRLSLVANVRRRAMVKPQLRPRGL